MGWRARAAGRESLGGNGRAPTQMAFVPFVPFVSFVDFVDFVLKGIDTTHIKVDT